MRYLSFLLLGSALITASCNAQDPAAKAFKTTPNGLEYKFIQKGAGTQQLGAGDFAQLNLIFKIGDSLVINTLAMNENKPVMQQCQKPTMKGDLMEGLMMMKAGDSAIFRMSMDTLAARMHQPKPEYAKAGDYATWEVRMVNVMTKEQMEAETAKAEKGQSEKEDQELQAYFKKNNIQNVKKTASGMYYVIHKPGTGESPVKGQKVTVNYTGKDLNGKKFDSNVDSAFHHVQPFSFDLDQHQVIKGWDEGLALMKKGMEATFYIPSKLAYGQRGAGGQIPPNSILIFDIELVSFQ
jgi:FKBP-type peptidyl-prolyl cis-trans isomerase